MIYVAYILVTYLISYIIYVKYFASKNLVHGFEKVKDLIRGTINTGGDIDQLYNAYLWFKSLDDIEIIDIKDIQKLDTLQNITVNYIYQDRFIGEMQFRYNKPDNFNSIHFIYEIFRSKMKIEIL
jgi:hypothetical protein